jgi:hypothetical protein
VGSTLVHPGSDDDLSSHLHRQVIGYLGASLPLLLFFIAGERPTRGLERSWALLDSASAYYYTSAIIAFVGVLTALGVYLLTYRGYANDHYGKDRVAATIAGVAALLVATFPTAAPKTLAPIWWKTYVGAIHYTAAAVLFSSFAFFSLYLFTRSGPGPVDADKRRRNRFYIACGIGIVASLLVIAFRAPRKEPIFWPEVAALECFALSWLAKGRALWTARQIGTGAIRYGRDPRQLRTDLARSLKPPSRKAA